MSLVISKFFNKGFPGKKLLDLIKSNSPEIYVTGTRGSASSFFISMLFGMLKKNFVIIADSHDKALETYYELLFFLGHSSSEKDSLPHEVLLFPPLETEPYENVLSHCDISAQRMWTLYRLCESNNPSIIVTSLRAVLQKILPADILIDSCHILKNGDEIDRDKFCTELVESGYTRVNLVEDRGDMSIRGEVMDIFPPGYQQPVRIDFFGDYVESIRVFDPATQRSCSDLNYINVVPVREVILSRSIIDSFRKRCESPAFSKIFSHGKGRTFAENIHNGFLCSGIEYCLSFIYPELETLYDYISDDSIIFLGDRRKTEDAAAILTGNIETHYLAAIDEKRVVSSPEDLFIKGLPDTMQQIFFETWDIEHQGVSKIAFSTHSNDDIRKDMIEFDSPSGALSCLAERIEKWLDDGTSIFLVCHTKSQCQRLSNIFSDYGLESNIFHGTPFTEIISRTDDNRIEIFVGRLSQGFRYEGGLLAVITEEEIFGEKRRRLSAPKLKQGSAISDFSDLKEGDCIVHRDSGIGIYRGLNTLAAGGISADYLSLEYLGGDKLYLPVDRINLINKYEGTDSELPKIDKLGGASWNRIKKRVKESVEKIARDLVELYSARKVHKGHAFAPPDHYYREFEAAFPYEETPDQLAAIQDVMNDMSNSMPMDRLICGDVGYGKTEVALRAAFRAVMDNRQAAILVPTTVLAQQHYQTFSERFSQYPVCIEILSRFSSTRDQRRITEELAAGKIDIIIGTHRLLQKDILFKNLGLIVIDEEHRFGVKHKENLKKIRTTVDVMTLTATPIPRTLQLSMLGIRDFSKIETPPEDRLSIRTVITHFDEGVIKDAILRELKRAGQVFFVHNRVKSIPAMALFLRRLIPGISLGIAHGQMKEHELEKAMMKFVKKEIDVLLCTTIIESGLDFPTANTIIINNANRLGLAQMYQLRGRVGRGKVRAYAYMLVPGKSLLSRDAARRLEALSEFTELGSGYRLATRDLQIRGAGNILGHSQSGQMDAVGIDMYLEFLNEAITELKGEKVKPGIDPEVNLNIQAYIPESYVPDINQRLVLYRRIASAVEDEELSDIEEEMLDRFGKLPENVETLLEIAGVKNILRDYLIVSVDFADREIAFTFHEEAEDSLAMVLEIISRDKNRFRFTPDHKLMAKYSGSCDQEILAEIKNILKQKKQ